MTLDDRKEVIRRLKSALYSLKNSAVKHGKDGDLDALKRRINYTVDELKKLAEELRELGCFKAASLSGLIQILLSPLRSWRSKEERCRGIQIL